VMSEKTAMEKNVIVRRCVHLLVALSPLYFLIPEELPVIEVRRWVLLILFFSSITLFETARLRYGISLLGLRPHESNSIASFVWAAAGITVALWFFPTWIATAVLVGMAIVDPIAGELRSTHSSLLVTAGVPVVVYSAICVAVLWASGELPLIGVVVLSMFGALVAVAAEAVDVGFIDDDFLMVVVPGITLIGLSLVL